jgi:hypothetical protein
VIWTREYALLFTVCATLDACRIPEDAPPPWVPVVLELAGDVCCLMGESINDWAQTLSDNLLAQHLLAIADDVEEDILEHPELSIALLREAAQRFRENAGDELPGT